MDKVLHFKKNAFKVWNFFVWYNKKMEYLRYCLSVKWDYNVLILLA